VNEEAITRWGAVAPNEKKKIGLLFKIFRKCNDITKDSK
jgi:hypothetical protein